MKLKLQYPKGGREKLRHQCVKFIDAGFNGVNVYEDSRSIILTKDDPRKSLTVGDQMVTIDEFLEEKEKEGIKVIRQ